MRGLCQSFCEISHISDCDDTRVMLAAHSTDESTYNYEGDYRIIDIGAAGTSMPPQALFLVKVDYPWEDILTKNDL